MSKERLSMRKIKNILRLRFQVGLSLRDISRSLGVSYGTVSNYIQRATEANLSWPLPDELDERTLGRLLFPSQTPSGPRKFTDVNYSWVHQQLTQKGVTKQLLWQEYRENHPDDGYSYSQFCHRYKDWLGRQTYSMRQSHPVGERLFVDYSGPTVPIVNPSTGELRNAEIFVAVLGASNYTFVCATWSQSMEDWIGAHVKAFEFYGGVPELVVPDQLKSAVTQSHRYDPGLNESYQHMAQHYRVGIMPARPRKPKDKAKVENAVLVVQRWILARLRNLTFFSLFELNQHIRRLLEDLNNRPFKKLPGSRRSHFERWEQQVLRPLPTQSYQYTHIKQATVHIDYHIEYEKHYYSVPHHLVKQVVQIHATAYSIAVYASGKRVASHLKSAIQGAHTTLTEHMPDAHRSMSEWSPERFLDWAADIGPETRAVVNAILQEKRHYQQSYRRILALLSNAKKYGRQRLNQACRRALDINSPTRKSVESILKQGLDLIPLKVESQAVQEELNLDDHENIRGEQYYH